MTLDQGKCVRKSLSFTQGWGVLEGLPRVTSERDFRLEVRLPFYEPWKVGQFVMVRWGRHLVGRPFAIVDWQSRPGGESLMSLWVRRLGAGTEEMFAFEKGQVLQVTAPLGQGFARSLLESPCLLYVSGGVGAASVLPLARVRASGDVRDLWLHGERGVESLDREMFQTEFSRCRGTLVLEKTSEGETPSFQVGRVTDVLRNLKARDLEEVTDIVACGPTPMLEAVAKVCADTDTLKDKGVCLGLEEKMGCGVGFCFSCSVWTPQGMKRLCTEGPWFSSGELEEHWVRRGGRS